jgi:hypothetical protein
MQLRIVIYFLGIACGVYNEYPVGVAGGVGSVMGLVIDQLFIRAF